MNLAQNQALKIFLTSFVFLLVAIIIIYNYNYRTIAKDHLELSAVIASEISVNIENHLIEKVKTVKTIAISPVILEALHVSNKHFGKLTQPQRDEEINAKNEAWKSIKDEEDKFISRYTNNGVSQYLKNLQNSIKGEYGEIFVTDKFGALVASTAKLTTFAHGSKYWWKGAYNNGEGAVFFDDRGYDDSVDGYVMGVVIPIKDDNEIIGILKANLNILGSISEMILNGVREESEQIFLIRSGGLIVYTEGLEPLSKTIPPAILEKISINEKSFILKEKDVEGIYAASEIKLTAGKPGFKFGGDFRSIDHKMGNMGESWYILDSHPMSHIIKPVKNNFNVLFIIGSLLSIILAFISMAIGKHAVQPIKKLIKQIEKITEGNFNTKVHIKRADEIGQLATSFNQMAKSLNETTTSLDKLNAEVIERQKKEEALFLAAQKWQITFNASKDIIWVLDKDHKIMQSNIAAKEIFGKPIEDMIGMSCHTIVHNSQEPSTECPFERAKKSLHRESMELNIGEKWYEVTIDPILDKDNNFIGGVHFIRDITERKEIQNEIEIKTVELENQLERSEKNRIANLVILKDLNKATKTLKLEVSERIKTEEILTKKMSELEIFNDVAVDREIIINNLRKELNDLLIKLGKDAKYKVVI